MVTNLIEQTWEQRLRNLTRDVESARRALERAELALKEGSTPLAKESHAAYYRAFAALNAITPFPWR